MRPEDLIKKLAEIAAEHKEPIKQLREIHGDSPEVIALRNDAKKAFETGGYEQAKGLLRQARQANIAAAEMALTQLRYDEAAADFGEAYATTPPSHANQKRTYLEAQADAIIAKATKGATITRYTILNKSCVEAYDETAERLAAGTTQKAAETESARVAAAGRAAFCCITF